MNDLFSILTEKYKKTASSKWVKNEKMKGENCGLNRKEFKYKYFIQLVISTFFFLLLENYITLTFVLIYIF